MKNITYILILISLNCFGQDINTIAHDRLMQSDSLHTWLQPNRQPEMKHLTAFLNETKDTVKVRSELTIGQVSIFNDKSKFNWSRPVFKKEVDIPLNDIPNGQHVLHIISNGAGQYLYLNVYVEPKEIKPSNKKTIIHIPYNNTTTKIRRDTRFSDTIYVKESREAYIRRMDSLQGKRIDLKFEKE